MKIFQRDTFSKGTFYRISWNLWLLISIYRCTFVRTLARTSRTIPKLCLSCKIFKYLTKDCFENELNSFVWNGWSRLNDIYYARDAYCKTTLIREIFHVFHVLQVSELSFLFILFSRRVIAYSCIYFPIMKSIVVAQAIQSQSQWCVRLRVARSTTFEHNCKISCWHAFAVNRCFTCASIMYRGTW